MRRISMDTGRLALGLALATGTAWAADDQIVIQYSPWLPDQHTVHEGLIRPGSRRSSG